MIYCLLTFYFYWYTNVMGNLVKAQVLMQLDCGEIQLSPFLTGPQAIHSAELILNRNTPLDTN